MRVRLQLFTETYTSRVVVRRPSEVAVKAIDSRLFSSLDSTWRFRPGKAANTTLVDFSVEFEVKNLLAAQAMDVFFEEVALQQVKSFYFSHTRADRSDRSPFHGLDLSTQINP